MDEAEDYTRKILAEFFRPGEKAVGPARFTVPSGNFHRKPPPPPPRSALKTAGIAVLGIIVYILFAGGSPSLARMLGRVPAEGHEGSLAHHIFRASRAAATETTFAVLTRDTLLIIAVRKAGTDPREEIMRIPRAQVTRARLRGRNLVKLRFADKSRIKLKLDMTTPDMAQGFTRELWPNVAVH